MPASDLFTSYLPTTVTHKNYLVQFRPVNTYFFGGETTFSEGEDRNFFVQSLMYPQQTALLGAIRHQLLLQNQYNFALAGNHSFLHPANTANSFGIIERLSPLFFLHATKGAFLLLPAQFQQEAAGSGYLNLVQNTGRCSTAVLGNMRQQGVPLQINTNDGTGEAAYYKPKAGLQEALVNAAGEKIPLHYDPITAPDGVFIACARPGIKRNYLGQTEDNAYYRQTFYRLNKGWHFAVNITLAQDSNGPYPLQDAVINKGAENSVFSMQVTEQDFTNLAPIVQNNLPASDYHRIVLLSDAFVNPDVYAHCIHAISSTVSFRALQTSSSTTNWYDMSRDASAQSPFKTMRYHLLKRGSVLYTNAPEQVMQALDNLQWQKIGFNHYITIPASNT